MKQPVRVVVTGAAGQIGYAVIFRIATGDLLGRDQPVILHLLEIPAALDALNGVVMELHDCTFPLLHGIVSTSDPKVAFQDVEYALLIGARPRGPGMERKDLLSANAQIFSTQGQAINEVASRNIKVVVVGNPANTNALITQQHAPAINPRQITAMTRLDHNRAIAQFAEKVGCRPSDLKRMIIWGNHSTTQYPDIEHATVSGESALVKVDQEWYQNVFIPAVAQRGAAVIKARGLSSAASAASAVLNHVRDWTLGTPEGDWVSMAVPSDGSYGVKDGVIYSYPVVCQGGQYSIVSGLAISDFSRQHMQATEKELFEERRAVEYMLPNG